MFSLTCLFGYAGSHTPAHAVHSYVHTHYTYTLKCTKHIRMLHTVYDLLSENPGNKNFAGHIHII